MPLGIIVNFVVVGHAQGQDETEGKLRHEGLRIKDIHKPRRFRSMHRMGKGPGLMLRSVPSASSREKRGTMVRQEKGGPRH